MPRLDFELPEDDRDALDATGLAWDAIIEQNVSWVVLRNHPVPAGYNVSQADAAVRIPPKYPDAALDMVYFYPALSLQSGRAIAKLTRHVLEGRDYQQWSRHYEWQLGVHSLGTHLLLVKQWLQRELR